MICLPQQLPPPQSLWGLTLSFVQQLFIRDLRRAPEIQSEQETVSASFQSGRQLLGRGQGGSRPTRKPPTPRPALSLLAEGSRVPPPPLRRPALWAASRSTPYPLIPHPHPRERIFFLLQPGPDVTIPPMSSFLGRLDHWPVSAGHDPSSYSLARRQYSYLTPGGQWGINGVPAFG